MALFPECLPQCARKILDTADIVRDGMFQELSRPAMARAFSAMSVKKE